MDAPVQPLAAPGAPTAAHALQAQLALAEQRAAVAEQYKEVSEGYKRKAERLAEQLHELQVQGEAQGGLWKEQLSSLRGRARAEAARADELEQVAVNKIAMGSPWGCHGIAIGLPGGCHVVVILLMTGEGQSGSRWLPTPHALAPQASTPPCHAPPLASLAPVCPLRVQLCVFFAEAAVAQGACRRRFGCAASHLSLTHQLQ